MPPQTQNAAEKVRLLLQVSPSAIGIRIDMTNDWGSHTGFTYTLGFATADDVKKDDEKIELEGGGVVFVDRKTLWVGEGGLLGATMDIDDNFSMKITPKEPRARSSCVEAPRISDTHNSGVGARARVAARTSTEHTGRQLRTLVGAQQARGGWRGVARRVVRFA
eukprot:3314427-Prymnesium_polylepis.1